MALPHNLSYTDVVKALEKAGFTVEGGIKGHLKMKKPKMSAEDPVRIAIIPMHTEIAMGTLRSIIEQAGLTREQFLQFLG